MCLSALEELKEEEEEKKVLILVIVDVPLGSDGTSTIAQDALS